MGMTIHYHGRMDDPARLDDALAVIREWCADHEWPCRWLDIKVEGRARPLTMAERVIRNEYALARMDDSRTQSANRFYCLRR
jgi:hypothetical protein